MATPEQQIQKMTEEFSKMKKHYGGLLRELMMCQEEILLLKRSNAEIREELDGRIEENEELKTSVGADGVRDELAQVKGDLKDLSRKLKSLEELTCSSRDVTTLEDKVQQTTDSLQSGLEETDNRVDRLHRLFNRLALKKEKEEAAREESSSSSCGTASGPHSLPYSKGITNKTPTSRPAPKESGGNSSASATALAPHPSSSTPASLEAADRKSTGNSTSRPFAAIDRLSPEERRKIQQKSWFQGSMFDGNLTHIPKGPRRTKVVEYDVDWGISPYLNRRTGSYGVPVKGMYIFGVLDGGVVGGGEVEWFVCRGDGRREKLTGRSVGWNWYGHDDVEWECDVGEDVWVEGVGVGQDVTMKWFRFNGMLLLD